MSGLDTADVGTLGVSTIRGVIKGLVAESLGSFLRGCRRRRRSAGCG